MSKININARIPNRLTGSAVLKSDGLPATLYDIAVDSLNAPPTLIPRREGKDPRHESELRSGIIEKFLDAQSDTSADANITVDLRPDEVEEILFVVSVFQPAIIVAGIKRLLQ